MNLFSAKFFLFLLLLSALSIMADAQTFYGTDDVEVFREGRGKEFRNKAESPLKEEDFAGFKGLNYFSVDNNFRVEADFTRTSDEKYFQMPTSSGKAKKYIKFSVLKFKLDGKTYSLNAYQADADTLAKFPEYKDLLFVPFKDATNGKETYGGGRYVNIKTTSDKKVILDFNLAYNPSCAYGSNRYSCPIPPKENFLQVEIKAGEKSYKYSTAR
jgi:uncharacterized protein (DUF1684 family)